MTKKSGYNIISVDLGGTKILTSWVNSSGEILARVKMPTKAENGKNSVAKRIAESITQLLGENALTEKDIKAVCVGVPGSVNPYTGIIGIAPNLGVKNYNIKAELEKFINIPVFIENDVNLGALGIQRFELTEKSLNTFVMFIGTGIGGALILDGKIYRGSNFFAGEIGHMHVLDNGHLCGCGKKGCLEAEAGRLAIVRNIMASVKKNKKTFIYKTIVEKKAVKSKAIAEAIKKKDPIVMKHVKDASVHIGSAAANIATLLNLDTIVLGGGVIEAAGPFMLPIIKKSFMEKVFSDAGKGVKIISTKLGDDAALYGGVALAEEMLNLPN